MQFPHYEDKYFHYFRKPHNLATTFGKQKSFLDYFETDSQFQYIFQSQNLFFSREEEFWLVNRLDNATAGLLYFAKTPLFKQQYKELQSQSKTTKIYLSDVEWNLQIKHWTNPFWITSTIAHHRFESDRMVVLHNDFGAIPIIPLLHKYKHKIKWRIHEVKTQVTPLRYNEKSNSTTCRILISKWIRHQIRAHLASIGSPILGEKIYNKKTSQNNLCLRSIGLKV